MADPQIETVQMEDGRVVEFTGKRRVLKETFTKDGKAQVRLDFRTGATRLFTVPEEMLLQFASHGASQKLGDSYAGLEKVEDAVIAVDDMIDRLYDGQWAQKREGGMAGVSVLLEALVRFTGKGTEEIRRFLAGKTHAEKLALRNNPKVKPIVQEIEDERAAKSPAAQKVDTEELLAELG